MSRSRSHLRHRSLEDDEFLEEAERDLEEDTYCKWKKTLDGTCGL